jgi:hypothetical protein
VHEYVLAAIVRLDEAEALLTIIELYGARRHLDVLSLSASALERQAPRLRDLKPGLSMFGESLNVRLATAKAKRPDRPAKVDALHIGCMVGFCKADHDRAAVAWSVCGKAAGVHPRKHVACRPHRQDT